MARAGRRLRDAGGALLGDGLIVRVGRMEPQDLPAKPEWGRRADRGAAPRCRPVRLSADCSRLRDASAGRAGSSTQATGIDTKSRSGSRSFRSVRHQVRLDADFLDERAADQVAQHVGINVGPYRIS